MKHNITKLAKSAALNLPVKKQRELTALVTALTHARHVEVAMEIARQDLFASRSFATARSKIMFLIRCQYVHPTIAFTEYTSEQAHEFLVTESFPEIKLDDDVATLSGPLCQATQQTAKASAETARLLLKQLAATGKIPPAEAKQMADANWQTPQNTGLPTSSKRARLPFLKEHLPLIDGCIETHQFRWPPHRPMWRFIDEVITIEGVRSSGISRVQMRHVNLSADGKTRIEIPTLHANKPGPTILLTTNTCRLLESYLVEHPCKDEPRAPLLIRYVDEESSTPTPYTEAQLATAFKAIVRNTPSDVPKNMQAYRRYATNRRMIQGQSYHEIGAAMGRSGSHHCANRYASFSLEVVLEAIALRMPNSIKNCCIECGALVKQDTTACPEIGCSKHEPAGLDNISETERLSRRIMELQNMAATVT